MQHEAAEPIEVHAPPRRNNRGRAGFLDQSRTSEAMARGQSITVKDRHLLRNARENCGARCALRRRERTARAIDRRELRLLRYAERGKAIAYDFDRSFRGCP